MARSIGFFSVSYCYTVVPESIQQLAEIFGKLQFLPLKIEFDPFSNCYFYIGYSKYFDLVSEGQKIPGYQVLVDTAMGEIINVQAEKMANREYTFVGGPVFRTEGSL